MVASRGSSAGRERRLFRLPGAVDVVLGALGVLVLVVTAYAGLAGTEPSATTSRRGWSTSRSGSASRARRCCSATSGGCSARGARSAAAPAGSRARLGGEELPEPLAYPERLGRWPAAAGVIGFGICELCWATAREPAPLAVLMLAYVVAMLVGMSLYGVEAWTRNADAFGVYFGMFAALAPLARRDGVLSRARRSPAPG